MAICSTSLHALVQLSVSDRNHLAQYRCIQPLPTIFGPDLLCSPCQVVVTGDFFQLPPVNKGSAAVKFAFEADMWSQTIKKTFNLTKVFRQRDPEFVDMLNEMRFGRLSDRSIAKFKSLSREIIYEDGLGATELSVLRLLVISPLCFARMLNTCIASQDARMWSDRTP